MTEEARATTGFKSSFSTFRTTEDADRRSRRAELRAEEGRRLPGLPRYGGSSFSTADRPAGGGPTYRLASLDRLAHRHKLYASEATDLNGSANGDAEHAVSVKRAGFCGWCSVDGWICGGGVLRGWRELKLGAELGKLRAKGEGKLTKPGLNNVATKLDLDGKR